MLQEFVLLNSILNPCSKYLSDPKKLMKMSSVYRVDSFITNLDLCTLIITFMLPSTSFEKQKIQERPIATLLGQCWLVPSVPIPKHTAAIWSVAATEVATAGTDVLGVCLSCLARSLARYSSLLHGCTPCRIDSLNSLEQRSFSCCTLLPIIRSAISSGSGRLAAAISVQSWSQADPD